jgi:hypothetical protein
MSSIAARPGAPELLVAGTTVGAMISRDGGQSWRWICEEAIGYQGSQFDARLSWTDDGTLLALGAGDGLRISRDLGCTWETPAGVAGAGITDLTLTGASPQLIWASTNRYVGDNALLVSSDGGVTFARTSLVRDQLFLTSVRALAGDPLRLRVAGWWLSPFRASLFASDDGGTTWREDALPGIVDPFYVLGGDPLDPGVLWLRTSGQASDRVLRADSDGAGVVTALETPTVVRGFVDAPDGRLWIATGDALFASADHGRHFDRLAHPTADACVSRRGDQLLACGSSYRDGWDAAASSDGGQTWKSLLVFANVGGAISCGPGTGAELCRGYWPAVAPMLGADPTAGAIVPPDAGAPDAAPPAKAAGGACAFVPGRAGPGFSVVASMVLLALFRRRFRKSDY